MSEVITKAELQAYQGAGTAALDSDLADLVVSGINDFITSETGRSWGEDVTATDEQHDMANVVFLRHQDVKSIVSVTRGNFTFTTVPASSYYFNSNGRLTLNYARNRSFAPQRDWIRVTYTYGVTIVPADLKLAALSLAMDNYLLSLNGQQQVRGEQIGSLKYIYDTGLESSTGKLHLAVIERYRTRNV